MTLKEYFGNNPEAAIAFSGGCDSALLLWAACRYGKKCRAYYVKTPFQPEFELQDALKLAGELKAPLTVIEHDTLTNATIAGNPQDRCYYCKKELFGLICKKAADDGFSLVLDGTNASDSDADRPGMRALRELSVGSPLRECGLTKPMVRELSQQAGLFTWDKPAYACLATRFPTGIALTEEGLKKVELSEKALHDMGFSDLRVRVRNGGALVQVPAAQLPLLKSRTAEVKRALSLYFENISIDDKPR